MIAYLLFEFPEKWCQSRELDVLDRSILDMLVMVRCPWMVWEVVVPDDCLTVGAAVLHGVAHSFWVALGRRHTPRGNLGERLVRRKPLFHVEDLRVQPGVWTALESIGPPGVYQYLCL